jgi:phosphatidylserine decarboxylase
MYTIFQTGNLLFTAGKPVLAIIIGAGLLCWFVYKPLLIAPIAFFLFSLYFFRNPVRTADMHQTDELVSPADGKIIDIDYNNQLHEGLPVKLSIFLSPVDVHVNWMPCDATITHVQHFPGKYIVAYAPKSSEINERLDLDIRRSSDNRRLVVRQVAGFIARRIICWAQPGDILSENTKYGMIRFGSRVDIFLPQDSTILMKLNDRVIGGQDIIARMPLQS